MKSSFYLSLAMMLLFVSCNAFFDTNPVHTTKMYSGIQKNLMDAVKNEDITDMDEITYVNKLKLDFADSIYGLNPLNWCIINGKQKAFKELLKLGADPNWQDTTGRYNPAITEAAKQYTTYYLEMALKYRGNPNQLSVKMQGELNQTPLLASIYPLDYCENSKLLLAHGADVNLTPDSLWSPLIETLIQERVETTKYFLDHGADINAKFKTNTGEVQGVLQLLREIAFPIGSKQHKIKMQIVEFLKSKGLDYWKEPIPEDVLREHKGETEYLSKY